MNRSETAALLGVATSVHPNMTVSRQTVESWALLLSDVPANAAMDALAAHLRTSDRYPTPALIRRAIAAAAGTLPPGRGDAWEQVRAAVRNPDAAIHPAVQSAARKIGWSDLSASRNAETTRAQFWRVYDEVVTTWENRVLTEPGALTENAIEAGPARPALPSPPVPPPSAPEDPEARQRAITAVRTAMAAFRRKSNIEEN